MLKLLLGVLSFCLLGGAALAALPSTTNYQLNSYGFGAGGAPNSTTANYGLEGISGEVSGTVAATSNYSNKPGFIQTEQANVPTVALTNPANYYDKLKFVISQQNNPTDALYALQVCIGADWTPNCGGTTRYVKNDNTLGASLTTADYQTYATWGGASGANIIGLSASTTYYIRALATQGKYTESPYGPSSNAATVGQSLSLCLYSNANCGAGGNSEAFGTILPNTLTNSPTNIGIDFATNADFGGNVYVYSANGGLRSPSQSYTITSASIDITSTEGFGAQIASVSQTTGGPLSKVSPYDGAGNNVGIMNTTERTILTSANPLTGGTGAIQLKVYASEAAPSANDYAETITFVAAASF